MLSRLNSSSMLRTATRGSSILRSTLIQQRAASTTQDDRNIGDYPKVPFEWYQHRDPNLTYQDQQSRRNFNDPLYQEYDFVDVWSPDRFDEVSNWVAIRNNIIFFSGILAFSGFCYYYLYPERKAVPRSYPYGGLYKALGASEDDKEVFQANVDEGN